MARTVGAFLVVLLIILSTGAYALYDRGSDDNEPEPEPGNRASWTFMVYLDADNNLESAGIKDLNEIEVPGSTHEVDIVALMDRCEGYDTSNGDWTDWRYYHVARDPGGLNNEIISTEVDYPHFAPGEEPNMGDPQTLIDFVTWSMIRYPADHYLLSLWNHGGGIRGVCWDDSTPDHDNLDLNELNYALSVIQNTTNETIDIIGFDACLMAGVSIHYEIRQFCDIVVASEATESNDGWPYDLILNDLTAQPSMPPETLARKMVEYYIESYGVLEPWVTQSAFWTGKMDQVYTDLDAVCTILMDNLPEYSLSIADSRENAESYDLSKEGPYMPELTGYPMCDLWDLLDELSRPEHGTAFDPELMQAITILKNSISAARIAFGHGTDTPNSHGLSIYFPQTSNTSTSTYSPLYDTLSYAEDHLWDDFLKAYYVD